MITEKKGKFDDFSERDNLFSVSKLLTFSSEFADIIKEFANYTDEINYLHKSVANLRPDIRKIVREELTAAFNGGVQG